MRVKDDIQKLHDQRVGMLEVKERYKKEVCSGLVAQSVLS